jgi:hypothetical protein
MINMLGSRRVRVSLVKVGVGGGVVGILGGAGLWKGGSRRGIGCKDDRSEGESSNLSAQLISCL